MNSKVQQEIADLKKLIRKWDKEYYVDSLPSVEDFVYDQHVLRLQELESKYPEYKTLDSPTLRFGSDLLNDFKEVKHSAPILSLDKVYDLNLLKSWIYKIDFNNSFNISVEPKIDGCSIVLYYKDGVLEKALTRGNGKFGNDVTKNIRTIRYIPLLLDEKVDLVLRGEVYITKENFLKINKFLGKPYTNSRNLASGILRRVDSREVANFPLNIFIYDFLNAGLEFKTNDLAIARLKKLGFKVNPLIRFFDQKSSLGEVLSYIADITKKRDSFEYEIDGVVLKVSDFALRERLGYTVHHPKWAMAYKFEALSGFSRVNSIVLQVGRSGKITPVANIDKVFVSGAFITSATLHNQDYITSIGLNVGDVVKVSRRGDVIPAVEMVINKFSTGFFKVPNNCPACETAVVKEGAHFFCPNNNCPSVAVERIKYFCSKNCMDIEGFSDKIISFLFEKKFISSEIDLYTFDFYKLLEFKGFKDRKINNLINSIEASKKKPFSKLLLSMGIKDLGENTIRLLFLNNLNSFSKLFKLCQDRDFAFSTLLKIKGIGEKIALNIIGAFNDSIMINKFKFFENLKFKMEEFIAIDDENKLLVGKKFCITGAFNGYSRAIVIDKLKNKGAIFNTCVTRSLDFLVVGEKAGSKLKKALSLNIKIMSFEDIKSCLD
ncbi:NAD-dependent DNA ligase LigA [Borreliella americana]|uniref:NAD-dependent DNA ligase LigA n=1 Tax=Borreliella americana TaxID=478807 RepID=UPI001E4E0A81|nr:NAD-dependent DNA ligase LigA [Borreliella americana]MCD2332157.1 NAD-dependent DNA ligase LigA [Borreliella americana]MCD2349812.1 NAD-dependent DNA ligase LigA [Borreliella americana]MCD2382178.1 NAD-dependent DNA ligase LigA [Borreliella americana]